MKQYIVVDDRFKIGQYLIGIAKSLMPNNKSVKIMTEEELHISEREKKYSKEAKETVECIKKGLQEVELIRKGKLSGQSLNEMLDEI